MVITPTLLANLNLSESQAAVYMATLELGESTILEIARKSGVKRSSIYNFIEELKSRGLLRETKKRKRAVFSAAPPRSLLEIEQTRLKDLQRLLPELEAVEKSSRTKPRVTFYEGVDGIRHVYMDSLSAKSPILGFSDFEAGMKVLGQEYYTERYMPERIRRGLLYRGIIRDSELAREYIKRDHRDLRESKLAPGEGVTTEINIYDETVALNSFRSKKPFAVIIEDKDIAQSLRYIWQKLWDRLPEGEQTNTQKSSPKTLKEEMDNQLKRTQPN